MKKNIFLCCLLLCMFAGRINAQLVNIIPYPQKVEMTDGVCDFQQLDRIFIAGDQTMEPAAALLQEQLETFGIRASISQKKKRGGIIVLETDAGIAHPEGYRLTVRRHQVCIQASSYNGMIYGIQSLLQMANAKEKINCCRIEDEPRYEWRGYMLDEARHFQGEKKVKQLIDLLSYYKINRFHWHLTDEQGWRIEIKAYPRLTQVGAIGNNSDPKAPAAFYTQEQIRDIVHYAAQRGIEVVPEIDMPGHAGASNRSYPEYQALGTDTHPDFCFNPGKEETYQYLTNILREITELFPSNYIHIGGDEVSFGNANWEKDEHIAKLMKREHLTNAREVEIYFLRRMIGVVNSLGKTAMEWDDIYGDGIGPDGNVITWWRHDKADKPRKMINDGFKLILCPRRPLYFDFVQHDSHKSGRRWDGFCPLEDVYAFPDNMLGKWGVTENDMKQGVMGLQANLWGETTHTSERVDFLTFPRIMALAESAWTTAEQKDYDSFLNRLEDDYDYLDKQGIYYFDARQPEAHPEALGPDFTVRKVVKD